MGATRSPTPRVAPRAVPEPVQTADARPPEGRPEAALAAAVLTLAVADAAHAGPVPARQARAWLLGSPWAAFWCRVAGLDVAAVRARLAARQVPAFEVKRGCPPDPHEAPSAGAGKADRPQHAGLDPLGDDTPIDVPVDGELARAEVRAGIGGEVGEGLGSAHAPV